MTNKEKNEAIAKAFGIEQRAALKGTVNAAVRKLPGGNELLDAIEATNAARNHADRARARDRVVAIDAALNRFEEIREAMERYVYRKAGIPDES